MHTYQSIHIHDANVCKITNTDTNACLISIPMPVHDLCIRTHADSTSNVTNVFTHLRLKRSKKPSKLRHGYSAYSTKPASSGRT